MLQMIIFYEVTMSNGIASNPSLDFNLENMRKLVRSGFGMMVVLTDDTKATIERIRSFFESPDGLMGKQEKKEHRIYMGLEWRGKDGLWLCGEKDGKFTKDTDTNSVSSLIKFLRSSVPSRKRYDADSHCFIIDNSMLKTDYEESDDMYALEIKPTIETAVLVNDHEHTVIRRQFIIVGDRVSFDESIKDFVMVMDDRKEKTEFRQTFEEYYNKTLKSFVENVVKSKVDIEACKAVYETMTKRQFTNMIFYFTASNTDITKQSIEEYTASVGLMHSKILFTA